MLIDQLERIIENRDHIEKNEACARALKEIVLSGLSRSGFLKSCNYLPDLDQYNNNRIVLGFIDQNPKEDVDIAAFIPFVSIELAAFGVGCDIKAAPTGFSFAYEGIMLYVFIYRKDFDLKTVYTYQQQPIPYEMRKITVMKEGVRSEIEKAIELFMESETADIRKKKEAAKTPGKRKRTKAAEKESLQPSLFDLLG